MSDTNIIEKPEAQADSSPSAQMAKAAAPPGTPTDLDRNVRLQNEREWIARYRMFDGDLIQMGNTIRHHRMGHLKQGFNIASSFIRSAFNYRNPMAILGSVVNLGLAAWDLRSSIFEVSKIVAKKNAFEEAISKHVALGDHIKGLPELRSNTGEILHAPEFVDIVNQGLKRAEFASHGHKFNPTPPR